MGWSGKEIFLIPVIQPGLIILSYRQTFGATFASDGRLTGEERIEVIPCDTASNTCRITVPAPGAALVFFSEPAVRETEASVSMTFATTAVTKMQNTATVDAEVLETSNGHGGEDRRMGSTSRGSSGAVGVKDGMMSKSIAMVVSAVAVAGVMFGGR